MKLTEKELRLILAKPPGRLTADDLRWLKPWHVETLSPAHVAGLTTSQLLGMNPKQICALTEEQFAVLTLEQMGLVPASTKRREVRLAVHTAKVERARASSQEHVLMLWQAWLFLFFVLLIPILRIAHKLSLI